MQISVNAELLTNVKEQLEDGLLMLQHQRGWLCHFDDLLWPWPLTSDLQNLTNHVTSRGSEYFLQVSSKLLKPFIRYRGNKISQDEWMYVVDRQPKNIYLNWHYRVINIPGVYIYAYSQIKIHIQVTGLMFLLKYLKAMCYHYFCYL